MKQMNILNGYEIADKLVRERITSLEAAVEELKAGGGTGGGTVDTSGTATADDILLGETAWVDGVKLVGTMPNNSVASAVTTEIEPGSLRTIEKGYHDGLETLSVKSMEELTPASATADDILTGKSAWVNGELVDGVLELNGGNNSNVNLQEKTVNRNGEITPDEGYDGLSKVIVDVDVEIENGVVASFYDEDGRLIQTHTGEGALNIGKPGYSCDAWFYSDGRVAKFPVNIVTNTNFWAQSNPTYADVLYAYFEVDKLAYPYICARVTNNNLLNLSFMDSIDSYNDKTFTNVNSKTTGNQTVSGTYTSDIESFVSAVTTKYTSKRINNSTSTIIRQADYAGNDAYVYTNFQNPGYTGERYLRLDTPIELTDGVVIDRSYTVNFHDNEGNLFESHTATCGMNVVPPASFAADSWQDSDGNTVEFPFTSSVEAVYDFEAVVS